MRAILTYHSVDDSGSPISCHPEVFDRHIRWFATGRVAVVPLTTLVDMPDSADAVALTFDDAFENFAAEAAPRLYAHGLPSTLFVVSDRAGSTNAWGGAPDPGIPVLPLLDWPAVARLAEDGVSIGAHTRTHRDLTTLDAREVEDEVMGSADAIERATGRRPDVFAYPYGHVTAAVASIVGRAFRYACTAEFGWLLTQPPPLLLPRLDAYYFGKPGSLEAWGTPPFARFVTRRRRLRRVRRSTLGAVRRLRIPFARGL